MRTILLITFGGAVGTLFRYAAVIAGKSIAVRAGLDPFPLGVLGVNVVGSLAIGFIGGIMRGAPESDPVRLAILIGLLGGFTTFSSFAWDTLDLLIERRYALAAANVLVSNILGLAAAWAGLLLGERLAGMRG